MVLNASLFEINSLLKHISIKYFLVFNLSHKHLNFSIKPGKIITMNYYSFLKNLVPLLPMQYLFYFFFFMTQIYLVKRLDQNVVTVIQNYSVLI